MSCFRQDQYSPVKGSDSENFITCVSDNSGPSGSWNNLLLQQKYFQYDAGYSYNQWIKDMRSGKKDGRFSAIIRGEESTISYRSISVMPGWYVIVELTNKNISDITQAVFRLGRSIWKYSGRLHDTVHADPCAVGEKR